MRMNKIFVGKKSVFEKIVLTLLFVGAFLLRFYRLDELPYGRNIDEVGLGYNAWSLANFGVDRYLNHLPIYASNFDGGQNPFYTYIVALLVKVLNVDITLILVRIPGALLSSLLVWVGYHLFRKRFDVVQSLLGALLLTVCPYFIMQGRIGLDCNSMLFMGTLALYVLFSYLDKPSTCKLILCGITFALVLYTYALSYVVCAIFLCTAALYLLYVRKITLKQCVIWAACVIVIALPIILFVLVTLGILPEMEFPFMSIVLSNGNRQNEFSVQYIYRNLLQMKYTLLSSDGIPYNATSAYGTLYDISVPLVYVGGCICIGRTIYSMIKRAFHYDVLITLYFGAEIAMGCLISSVPNINRLNGIYICFIYFIVVVVATVTDIISFVIKKQNVKIILSRTVVVVFAVIYIVRGCSFIEYYFRDYTEETYPLGGFRQSAQDAIDYAEQNLIFDNLYIDYTWGFEHYMFDNLPLPGQYELLNGENIYTTNHYDGIFFNLSLEDDISPRNVYIVHCKNQEYMDKIAGTGYAYEIVEFEDYYLYNFLEE